MNESCASSRFVCLSQLNRTASECVLYNECYTPNSFKPLVGWSGDACITMGVSCWSLYDTRNHVRLDVAPPRISWCLSRQQQSVRTDPS